MNLIANSGGVFVMLLLDYFVQFTPQSDQFGAVFRIGPRAARHLPDMVRTAVVRPLD